jgi:hypothetical protein
MTKRITFEEMMEAPTPKTFVSEAIDFEVDFVVREETPTQRARRIWKMPEEEKEGAT